MGFYSDQQMFAAMDSNDTGYRDGLHAGAYSERQRVAEHLGTNAGTLALLGASDEESLTALRELQWTIAGRIDDLTTPKLNSEKIIDVEGATEEE